MACVYIPTQALGLIKVLLIWFFFSCVCAVITFFFSRQYIIDNWKDYKCNPLVTPFASAFGHDSTATMHDCLSVNFTAMSSQMHRPFMSIFDSMTDALSNVGSMSSDLNFMSSGITSSFGDGFSKILGQMGNVGSSMQFLIIKIETLLQRLVATVAVIMYSMSSLLNGILSVQRDASLNNIVDNIINFSPPA